jgi:hemolysin activation/secretion protein
MLKVRKLNLAILVALSSCYPVYAQDPGAVLKNIQQNQVDRKEEPAAVEEETPSLDNAVVIKNLKSIEVNSQLLNSELSDYWEDEIGQSVTADKISKFKSWAWERFRRNGYLSFVTTEQRETAGETTLVINVTTPKIHNLDFAFSTERLPEDHKEDVKDLYVDSFKSGDTVDILALEDRIQNSNFYLPIEMDASVKQTAPDFVDVTLNVRDVKPAEFGRFLGATLQANTFGLEQYGRFQATGVAAFEGFTPFSEFKFSGQQSEGVSYGRGEYLLPVAFLKGQVHVYGSYSDFSSVKHIDTATQGYSSEYGTGISHLLGTNRYAAFKSHLDFSARHTVNELKSTRVMIGDLNSYQGRLSFTADNSKLDTDQYNFGVTFVGGHYTSDDGLGLDGDYGKMELNGQLSKTLWAEQNVLLSTRFRGQLSTTNLNSYDMISIGGTNGVRAYTTVDGLADQGGVVSIDLYKRFAHQQYAGIFYDAGVVKPAKNGPANQNGQYVLQGVGAQYGGSYHKIGYNFYVAKATGSYENYFEGNMESVPGNWRVNGSLSYSF